MSDIAIRCFIAVAFACFIRMVSGKHLWLFASFFWLAVFYNLTIIPGTIFRENCGDILVVGLFAFVFLNFIRIQALIGTRRIPFKINQVTIFLLGSFFLMYAIEFMRIFIVDDKKALPVMHLKELLFMLLIILSSLQYLYIRKGDSNERLYDLLLKPYYLLCVGISLVASINIILALTGIIDVHDWRIPDWMDRRLVHRDTIYSDVGGEYRFPLYTSLVMVRQAIESSFNYQGLFGIGGQFTGLSFEPHIAMIFVTPALFLSSKFHTNEKKAAIIKASFIVFITAASSVSNFMSLSIIMLLILLKERSHFFSVQVTKIWVGILFFCAFSIILYFAQGTFIYAFNKLADISTLYSSGGTAFRRLLWLYSPETFFGVGTFPRAQLGQFYWLNHDVGLIPMLTLTLHLVLLLFFSFKLFFSRDKYAYFGLCTIYLVLHNLKAFGDLVWNQFYLFMVFLLCLHLNYNDSFTTRKIRVMNPFRAPYFVGRLHF